MKIPFASLLCLSLVAAAVFAADAPQAPPFTADFESATKLPADWTSRGQVSIDASQAFKGKHSLLLQRSAGEMEKPCEVTTAPFPVKAGTWEFAVATKSELKSPDSSFNGVVTIEFLDAGGKVVDSAKLAEAYGRNNWQPAVKRVEAPAAAATARFHAQVNKAQGKFWVDELSAKFVSATVKQEGDIDRIVFATAQSGNLLYPEDPRTVAVTVVAHRELKQRDLGWVVRDYWGAEAGAPEKAALGEPKKTGETLTYETTIDLGSLALEPGRYYELHAELPREGEEPFRNYTTFAILPKPVTSQYKAEEIPFTNRNWNSGIIDFVRLANRLGIRMSSAANVQICQELGMGTMLGVGGIHEIEQRQPGWQKIDGDAIRRNLDESIPKFASVHPLMLTLGNEPPTPPDGLGPNVAAYKAAYEEAKKLDPNIIVVATSVGPVEAFFKAGFHEYCDVVDFHAYSDWREIKTTFETYDKLFAKYGHKKPVCSTEIGLNSQGLTRETVASDMIKKLASFFECGGTTVSWFDLGYPDPDVKLADDSTSAFNVFDCRYNRYCPKLDAVTYYNMINGICIKKPAGEKMYEPDIYTYLFRDRDNHCMQIIWKEKGRRDVLVPLPGVGKVTAIDIDGRRTEMDAGGTGLTLTVNEDPLILLFDSADLKLADQLGTPEAELASTPDGLVKGGSASLGVKLGKGATADEIEAAGPALWSINKTVDGDGNVALAVAAPSTTTAREGRIAIRIKDEKGGCRGELRAAVPVTGAVTLQLMPDPGANEKQPGVKLIIRNHTAEKQEVSWSVALTHELPMSDGKFDNRQPQSAVAYFADATQGTRSIAGNGAAEIVVPLAGVDPLNVYGVKGTVTDAQGRILSAERYMAGFVRVPHAKGPINLDGSMKEADWKNAPVEKIDEARQYYVLGKGAKWKGPQDLSAKVRFLWDEKYLYIGVNVTDDIFCNTKTGSDIWAGDGLQFMVDPARDKDDKPGKYDLAAALTKNGPEAWCFLSADGRAPSGEAKDIVVAPKRLNADRGDMSYLVAIPWMRIAPFTPEPGGNLGLCVTVNEDDGTGRASFMTWFGDVESKQVDVNGDLILGN